MSRDLTYDGLNRYTGVTIYNSTHPDGLGRTMSYGAGGNLTSRANQWGQTRLILIVDWAKIYRTPHRDGAWHVWRDSFYPASRSM